MTRAFWTRPTEPLKKGDHCRLRLECNSDEEPDLTGLAEEKVTSDAPSAAVLDKYDEILLTPDEVRWLHDALGALLERWDKSPRTIIHVAGEGPDVLPAVRQAVRRRRVLGRKPLPLHRERTSPPAGAVPVLPRPGTLQTLAHAAHRLDLG